MKFFGMALLLVAASACKVDQGMIDAMQREHDKRTGLEALASETGKALKEKCSTAYIEGLAVFKNGKCDDSAVVQKSVDPIDADSDDDGLFVALDGPLNEEVAARYSANMLGDFIPFAAEAQDYNSSRSNKPNTIRADVIGGGSNVLARYHESLSLIFTGEDDGQGFVGAIGEEMAAREADPKFAMQIYSDFIKSLQDTHAYEERLKKSSDRKQSEAIYERAAKKSRMSVDQLKDIVKSAKQDMVKGISIGAEEKMIGFGSFSISKRSARTGRNPQTGKEIQVAAKRVVKFKAGAELSKAVN